MIKQWKYEKSSAIPALHYFIETKDKYRKDRKVNVGKNGIEKKKKKQITKRR
jgi:hypothetical protein